jgi:chemotaxis protein methyltransferase CheR
MERRWFRLVGREYVLDPSIRGAVRFEERNLADEEPGLWLSEAYDVVFCRNVLMYLTPETARAVVARVARSLVPSGHLFLGHAETLRGLSHDFHLRHTHDTFYYQRKDELTRLAGGTTLDSEAWLPEASPLPVELDWASTWIETVQRSTERIRGLSEQRSSTREAGAPSADGSNGDRAAANRHACGPPARGADLRRVIALLERERFGDALALIADLPRNEARDPDVLLLRAVLLTHSGELDAAESVCSELCGVDELSAGAHYLLALCREGAGDRKAALEHDGVAAYLDPDFAMPRLHLGLLARREGDMPSAERELQQALALLTREEPSRILLFGGGFTREALMHLCRAELRAARGDP